jgi:predicted nucleotidyltransferase
MNHPLSKFQTQIDQIAKANNISYLALFGSTARGDDDVNSDIDLLVNFDKRLSLLDLVQVERNFSTTFNRPVDLIPQDSLNKYVKPYVVNDLITLYDQR